MALVVDLLCRAVVPTFLDVRIRRAAMVSHTWKGVELLRDLRYAAGGRARCKLNGDVKFDGKCNVDHAGLNKQAAAYPSIPHCGIAG
jgi:hypothetical protein